MRFPTFLRIGSFLRKKYSSEANTVNMADQKMVMEAKYSVIFWGS